MGRAGGPESDAQVFPSSPCPVCLVNQWWLNWGRSTDTTEWKWGGKNTHSVSTCMNSAWLCDKANYNVLSELPDGWTKLSLSTRAASLEKTLMLGKMENRRRRGRQRVSGWMASPTRRTWVWPNTRRRWRTGKPRMLHFTRSQRVRHYLATEQQKQKHHTDKYVPQTEPVSLLVFFF